MRAAQAGEKAGESVAISLQKKKAISIDEEVSMNKLACMQSCSVNIQSLAHIDWHALQESVYCANQQDRDLVAVAAHNLSLVLRYYYFSLNIKKGIS